MLFSNCFWGKVKQKIKGYISLTLNIYVEIKIESNIRLSWQSVKLFETIAIYSWKIVLNQKRVYCRCANFFKAVDIIKLTFHRDGTKSLPSRNFITKVSILQRGKESQSLANSQRAEQSKKFTFNRWLRHILIVCYYSI